MKAFELHVNDFKTAFSILENFNEEALRNSVFYVNYHSRNYQVEFYDNKSVDIKNLDTRDVVYVASEYDTITIQFYRAFKMIFL